MADGSRSPYRHDFPSRRPDLAAVRELLRAVTAGRGGAMVIRGEAGIGKTELVEQALESVPEPRRIDAAGREFETELAFTALQDLCRPVLAGLESLPAPQREALEVALALRDGAVPDPFRIGLAVIGLLSAAARERPIVCVVDDAQWLDHASAQVFAFVARRVAAEPAAFLIAMRDPSGNDLFDGLPARTLTGIGDDDALALLAAQVRVPLDERIRRQIVAEAHGNPLALLELPRHSRGPAALAGGFGLPEAVPVPERIEAGYRRSLDTLPAPARTLLLLAAAEPLGDPVLLWRAAERLGLTADDAGPAEAAGLLDLGVRVRFRHPLVRSAVYGAAEPADRRAVHRALAEATDPGADPDRRAWHRGQSVVAPDESVAEPLERSADQAYARGGMAAAARFLERAAALTPDPARRAARALAAAGYKYRAGDIEAARRLLATAEAGPLDERRRALAALLAAQIAALPARAEAPSLLFGAARGLEAHDRPRAYEGYLEAFGTAVRSGRLGDQRLLTETARAARAALAQAPPGRAARPLDLLLGALTAQVTEGQVAALPMMRAAIDAFLNADGPGEASHWIWLANSVAIDLGDEDAWLTLAEREVRQTRRSGALIALPIALGGLAVTRVHFGRLAEAAALIDEAYAVNQEETAAVSSWAEIALAAWRGEADRVAELAESGSAYVRERGLGIVLTMFDHTTAVVHNAGGHYDLALRAARAACHQDDLGYRLTSPPELVEAAARSGQPRLAEPVLRQLVERTDASGTDLALGLQYRCRALLSTGSEAEKLYRRAIDRLEHAQGAGHLARAHLLYGEWLRREARRGEARDQLRIAHEMLGRIGAAGFAARAARELAACGERARRRSDNPLDLLTAQERRIALLVADGATSKEAAARLFLSPRTIDAHLRSIFKKLDLTSRRQLRDLRPRLSAPPADGDG